MAWSLNADSSLEFSLVLFSDFTLHEVGMKNHSRGILRILRVELELFPHDHVPESETAYLSCGRFGQTARTLSS